MGVIVNKNERDDNELTRRIVADLQRKQAAAEKGGAKKVKRKDEEPDLVEDAEYMEDFKKTSKFGWVWIVLIVLAIGAIISIVMI